MKRFLRFSISRSKFKKKVKIANFSLFSFQCVAKSIGRLSKILTSYLVNSHIWQNPSRMIATFSTSSYGLPLPLWLQIEVHKRNIDLLTDLEFGQFGIKMLNLLTLQLPKVGSCPQTSSFL